MHLRKLSIHTLPGIEPGFTIEPPDAGVNIVVGPNAIGKSSLARALKYLLASEKSDPVALSLEAEFESRDARWEVTRNGSQIVWRRNGAVASSPALPTAAQIGLYRLSVEHLLDAEDAHDRNLAGRLRRELHGNFDLGQLRAEIRMGQRFARRKQPRWSPRAKRAGMWKASMPPCDGRKGNYPALHDRSRRRRRPGPAANI